MKMKIDGLDVVVVYDFYQECATKNLALEDFGIDPKEMKLTDFKKIKAQCSKQGLRYSTSKYAYPGDKFMFLVTSPPKGNHLVLNKDGLISKLSRGRLLKKQKLVKNITQEIFNDVNKCGASTGILCGDLTLLKFHESKMLKP